MRDSTSRTEEHCVLSVVIPLYNEEDVLPRLYDRLTSALDTIESHEIILVNDGSRDRTLSQLLEFTVKNHRIIVIDLSRNFGHQAAVMAGLEAARGDAVILMDGDLQDPPEVIPSLLAAWREGHSVVIAHRRSRQDSGLRGAMFRLFYRVFDLVSDFPIQPDAGIFSLLDRQAVNELLRFRERNRYLPGLRSWIGFDQTTVLYDRAARAAGEPKQTAWRLLRYGFDAIFSFSYKPLRLSWALGLFVSTLAFIYGAILVIARLLDLNVVSGFTTTTVAILFLGGLQLIMIGILGEYLARIYDEVKQRPSYIVARRVKSEPSLDIGADHDVSSKIRW
jgi:dolichol-phosphate mannosyltransferase